MKQIVRWGLWFALFGSGGAFAQSPEPSPFLGGFLQESRIVYPLRLAQWEARDEHLYDRADLGASVRFQQKEQLDRWVDVYFYPAGILPPERLDQDVAATLEGIRLHAVGAGGYERLEVEPVRSFAIEMEEGGERKTIQARSAALSFEKDGKTYHSALVMLVKDLYFIKGRFSAEAAALTTQEVQSQLEAMIGDLVRETTLISTGECWMPAPITQATGPLDGKAQGAVMSIADDKGFSAVGFADRIEALDPDSPQARVVQLGSMPLTGRAVPGCLPGEDINPVVPAGKREIRFEYRATGEQAPGAPGRLVSGRRGLG